MINKKPSKEEAEDAIRLILTYIGEDPAREGLLDTPKRVISSYEEMFKGYKQNLESLFKAKFYNISEFNDLVLLKNIEFSSFCEHHLLPIYGKVDIAYYPDKCVIGISKLARLIEIFAKRLQIQEKMTTDIAEALQQHLCPLGAAVKISAKHSCMSMRGVLQKNNILESLHFTGVFKENNNYRKEFLMLTNN